MGNCHVLFGKGPTEKDSNTSTSSVAYFTRAGGLGKRTWSNPGTAPQADPTGGALVERQLVYMENRSDDTSKSGSSKLMDMCHPPKRLRKLFI